MSVAELPDVVTDRSTLGGRRLFLVWQNPETRRFVPVGALTRDSGGAFVFRYIRRSQQVPGFRPLPSFPRLDGVYRSADLPPFFDNRVMSAHRPDYPDYVRALSLDLADATPFEMLARTGGIRATDTFHVVADPEVGPDGHVLTRFLAHGVRHLSGAAERIARLSPGDALRLRPAPDNPYNQRALLIDAEASVPVGYVPDWMLDFVHDLVAADPGYRLIVERANGPETPMHLRLLCRLEADRPAGYRPFDNAEFDYVES